MSSDISSVQKLFSTGNIKAEKSVWPVFRYNSRQETETLTEVVVGLVPGFPTKYLYFSIFLTEEELL
jgi:hypothetical protein